MSARVGIVGAGPVGLFTALLLARSGMDVRVFERHSAPNPHPRAMGITRRTAEIFLQCGLLHELEAGAMNTTNCDLARWCRSLVGEELGRVPIPEESLTGSPCHPMHIPQTHTEHVLREALKAEVGVEIHWGTAVTGLENREDGVRLELSGGRNEFVDWLVAADGASSSIRQWLGVETTGPGDLGHFINVFFRAPELLPSGMRPAILHHVFGGEFFEFFVTVNGRDLWLMHHFLQPGERVEEFSHPRLREIIRAAVGKTDFNLEILGVSPWVMSPQIAKTWRAGRVFLAGDASARLSPAGGLGLNTGLQSVWNLAWKLRAVTMGRGSDSLLDTYEIERRPWAHRLMSATNQNAEEIMAAVAAAIAGEWERVKEMAAASRRRIPDTALDMGGAYEVGALLPEPEDYPASGAKPGTRAPHLVLPDGKSILQFFGHDFVLLAGRNGEKWRGAEGMLVLVNGSEFFSEKFEEMYGVNSLGAVLVRPDGFVGARFIGEEDPAEATSALHSILHPALPNPEIQL